MEKFIEGMRLKAYAEEILAPTVQDPNAVCMNCGQPADFCILKDRTGVVVNYLCERCNESCLDGCVIERMKKSKKREKRCGVTCKRGS